VVAKLLHLTAPHLAYFGQKDAQQLWLIQRMVTDLDFAVEVVAVPTVRAADGLALSSRNIYLSEADRTAACSLYRALVAGEGESVAGPAAVRKAASQRLAAEPDVRVDYLELVDPTSFAPVGEGFAGQALLLVAAFVGTTRLIDNLPVSLGTAREEG
jgi:pantoate--beta-alanine ligase